MLKRKNNKLIIIGSILCSLILLGILGSYAYFAITGNNTNEEVSVETGNLALTFADGNNGITEALEFGGSVEKTFSIQNTGSLNAIARIMWDDLVNTYIDGSLTYTLSSSDTETGTYTNIVENQNVPTSTTSTKELLAGNLTIPNGSTKYYKLTIKLNYLDDVDQTADLKASLSTHFSIEESDGKDKLIGTKAILAKIGKKVKSSEGLNFAEPATTDETSDGLFELEDDYGTSYFYRGDVTDNYVKFGSWSETSSQTDKRGKDMYWRIIRVNGDGSVRMIYDGTSAHTNGESSTDRHALINVAWNTTNGNDAKYVGYMYGGKNGVASTKRINLGEEGYENSTNAIYNESDSNMKIQLESWYHTNLSENDDNIADVIYCNDRSIYTGEGFGKNKTIFNTTYRIKTTYSPQYKCLEKNDSFTKDDTYKGNGMLNEKIGLSTVDEIMIAGSGKYLNNKNSSFLKNSGITFSPEEILKDSGTSRIYQSINALNSFGTITESIVLPVISLTPEYFSTLVGDGTMGNPFREKGMEP